MPKTSELTIRCQVATMVNVNPESSWPVKVEIISPDIKSLLLRVHTDDLIEYVREYIGVEEIYSQSVLDKWAESEGYIKQSDSE